MTADKPLVSVVMPVYNAEMYVGQAIESVLAQTFADFELIVVNDGSTDTSFEVIKKYGESDKRVKVLNNEKNLGIVGALNRGIEHSQGERIARMDSDDYIDVRKFEKQINFLKKNPGVTIVSTDLAFINADGKKTGTRRYSDSVHTVIYYESPICHASVIMQRKLLNSVGGYKEGFPQAEDYDLRFRLTKQGGKFGIVHEPLYYYRIHSSAGKVSTLKKQLKSTILVKENAIHTYSIKFPLGAHFRLYFEKFLYYLVPAQVILFVFLLVKGKN